MRGGGGGGGGGEGGGNKGVMWRVGACVGRHTRGFMRGVGACGLMISYHSHDLFCFCRCYHVINSKITDS